MKSRVLTKRIILFASMALVLLMTAFVFTFGAEAAELPGKTFSTDSCYQMSNHIMPNGSITFEAEIYLPDAYRTDSARGGDIISNYDGGTYAYSYGFEMYTNRKLRLFIPIQEFAHSMLITLKKMQKPTQRLRA